MNDKALKAWNARLMRVYGITAEEYAGILKTQGGACAVCRRPVEEFNTRLCVDHDHKTMQIRGLLCYYCNHRLVGRHRDPELLRRIANYVAGGTGKYVPPKKRKKRRRK